MIFKIDTEELTEKGCSGLCYKEKSKKHYEGNKEVGGRISSNGGVTSISYGEIGEKSCQHG